jgi:hypothetical protein
MAVSVKVSAESRLIPWLVVVGGLLLLAIVPVLAAITYDLSWWSVDSGGATFSTGGAYELGGTIGQPDAGTLTGGGYTLGGGFWGGGAVAVEHKVYLPVVLRQYL